MANLSINETEVLKKKILKATGKGFGYFFKNALLVILVLLGAYVFAHPEIISNPKEFFSTFDRSSIYSFLILCVIVVGIYQLGKSILKDNRADAEEEEDRKENEEKEKHNEEIMKRLQKNPQVSNILKDLLINLNASRSSVCELQNGTVTLAGVPFVHLTMTYEEISNEVQYSFEDYTNINLSRLPFVSNHFKDGYWIGPTTEIDKEDRFLASKLLSNQDNYLGFMTMHGKNNTVLAILTVAFVNKDPDLTDSEIASQMMKASQQLSSILDKE